MFIFIYGVFRKRNLRVNRRQKVTERITVRSGDEVDTTVNVSIRNNDTVGGESSYLYDGPDSLYYNSFYYSNVFGNQIIHIDENVVYNGYAEVRDYDSKTGVDSRYKRGSINSTGVYRVDYDNDYDVFELHYDTNITFDQYSNNIIDNHVTGTFGCFYYYGFYDDYDKRVTYRGFDAPIFYDPRPISYMNTPKGIDASGVVGAGDAGRDPGMPGNDLKQRDVPFLHFMPPNKVGEVCFAAGSSIIFDDDRFTFLEKAINGTNICSPHHLDPDGEDRNSKITNVFHNAPKPVWRMVAHCSDGHEIFFGVTSEHPFWIPARGWIQAQDLETGDQFRSRNGIQIFLKSKVFDPTPVPVYNVEVEGNHTYYIGDDPEHAILVHNRCENEETTLPVPPGGWPKPSDYQESNNLRNYLANYWDNIGWWSNKPDVDTWDTVMNHGKPVAGATGVASGALAIIVAGGPGAALGTGAQPFVGG